MDGPKFDAMVRVLGAGGTRRGFVGLLAALAAGGVVTEAGAKRKCRKDSPAGQCCKKKGGVVSCTCTNGGTVCGTNCCLIGQECEGGLCVDLPEPTECIAFGEACKNVGKPCCENLVCASGQGGQDDVACYVRKTGRCTSTAECTFGTECVGGICVAPVPPPPGPTCNVQLGEICVQGDVCCKGTCGGVDSGSVRQPRDADRCCVGLGQPCTGSNDDCCDDNVCTSNGSSLVCNSK